MADMQGNKIFAVDFDGTLSQGAPFPEIGEANKPLFEMLIKEKEKGSRVILYTCRTGGDLKRAIVFCHENGLYFDTVNENLPELIEAYGGDTRKINADYYIDDKNLYFPTVGANMWQSDEDNERKYVIVCNEHSGNWAGVLLFWGHRTQDNETRSFGGYTSDIDKCELYSDRDLKEKGYHFPKFREGMTLEEFRGYDDVLIEPKYLENLGYKKLRTWYMP